MEISSSEDATTKAPSQPELIKENPSEDKEPKKNDPSDSDSPRLPLWLRVCLLVLPAGAFIISLFSLWVSFSSLRFSMGYSRGYEDHDVVARVLGVSALTKGFSTIVTNGELTVDIAIINKGNQTEIIREAFLCYSDKKDFKTRGLSWERNNPQMNLQLTKGDRRVINLSSPFSSINTGKRTWLGVCVRTIAPNADDIEVVWPVCEINLAPDGNGTWLSYNKDETPQIQLISNKRLPQQKIARDGF